MSGVTVVADDKVYERRIHVRLTWENLRDAIQALVGKELGLSEAESSQLEITIEQETAGSPSYSVKRWKAIVTGKLALDNPS